MNLLDRYIFKSVLFTCLAAVGLFAFVFALANFVRDLLGPLLAGQLSVVMLARLLLLLVPYVVIYTVPAGILTGVLLTLGRISADSEITAMRAAGIGVMRVGMPVLVLGALGTIGAVYSNFESMPWARVQYHRELADAVRKNPLKFIVPKTFIRDFKGMVVYVGDKSADSTRVSDVWVWHLDGEARADWNAHAAAGHIDFDTHDNSFVITLQNATVGKLDDNEPERVFDLAPKVQTSQTLEQFRIPVALYLGQDIFHVKPEWLRFSALQQRRAELEAQKPEPGKEKEAAVARMKLAIILHDKINLSLAVFAFGFVAVPLGIKVSRRETSANLGVAVLIVLSYYVVVAAIKTLDRHPEYRPDLLLWAPNLIFIGFGSWLIRRVER